MENHEYHFEIDFSKLINFFTTIIADNLSVYNSNGFQYPLPGRFSGAKWLLVVSNRRRIISDFIQFHTGLVPTDKGILRRISNVARQLKTPSSYATISLAISEGTLIPFVRKAQGDMSSSGDPDFVPQQANEDSEEGSQQTMSMSRSDTLLPCKRQRLSEDQFGSQTRSAKLRSVDEDEAMEMSFREDCDQCLILMDRNKLLEERVEQLEMENRQLKDSMGAELKKGELKYGKPTYKFVWSALVLTAMKIRMSPAQLISIMTFLQSSVTALRTINIPGMTCVHSCRYSISHIVNVQVQRFLSNANYLTLCTDGTTYRDQHYLGVVLVDHMHRKLLIGIEYLLDGYADTIVQVTNQILGPNKDLILSKLVATLSDTAAPQLEALRRIAEDAKKMQNRNIYTLKCLFHLVEFQLQ